MNAVFRREPAGFATTVAGTTTHAGTRPDREAQVAVTGIPGVTGELRLAASSVPGQHPATSSATFRKTHRGSGRVSVSIPCVLREVEHRRRISGLLAVLAAAPT